MGSMAGVAVQYVGAVKGQQDVTWANAGLEAFSITGVRPITEIAAILEPPVS